MSGIFVTDGTDGVKDGCSVLADVDVVFSY